MLIPFFHIDSPRGSCVHRGWLRAFVLGLALALTLALVDAATHRHDNPVDTHACAVCSILMDELPGAPGLPPLTAQAVAVYYLVLAAGICVCVQRFPVMLPPICGPPSTPRGTT